MDDDLRHHLTEMLAKLRPLVAMAERHGVPGRAAALLRVAAFEIEDALDPGATERRSAEYRERDRETLDVIRRREHEGAAWGFGEA